MTMNPEMLREIIREVVRDVVREVVAEEVALRAKPAVLPSSAPSTPMAPPTGGDVLLVRGALTERHLRTLGDSTVVRIGTRVVITPLARDWARARGIDIIRIDG